MSHLNFKPQMLQLEDLGLQALPLSYNSDWLATLTWLAPWTLEAGCLNG